MHAHEWTRTPLAIPGAGQADEDIDAYTYVHDHEELFAELLTRPDTLVLPVHEGQVLVDENQRLALLGMTQLPPQSLEPDALKLYLGRVQPAEGIIGDGILVAGKAGAIRVPVIAVVLTGEDSEALTVGRWKPLRQITRDLHAKDVGLATRAVALANWHRSHTFSPRTGNATTPIRGGWVRVDHSDNSEHFPRTDPAVIIAVTDQEDRLLLASNAAWEERVFSLIAGFVDPGESLEEAVVREVREESGLQVRDPVYLGSQPWPFPASLMLGFHARLASGLHEQRPDGVEIRELRWFTRQELSRASAAGEVQLPGHASIARSIISKWQGE